MGEGGRDEMGEGRDHPSYSGQQSLGAWWSRWEHEDPPATHVVTFRPVVQVRLALAPGVDPGRVIAEAARAWAGELSDQEAAGRRGRPEFWGASLGDSGLVVEVEHIDASYTIESNPLTARRPHGGRVR